MRYNRASSTEGGADGRAARSTAPRRRRPSRRTRSQRTTGTRCSPTSCARRSAARSVRRAVARSPAGPGEPAAWRRRRTRSTPTSTSTSRGRSSELPERERTKHVHRLHPYLGKFIPQLVEVLLDRHLVRGRRVLDPFAGSGTTLVQALESGIDAAGVDVAAFNCLLMRVKTRGTTSFALEHDLRDALARFERGEGAAGEPAAYRARLVRAAARRGAARVPLADRRRTSTPTSCASCSRARPARRGGRRTSTSTSRARRSAGRTGATSTGASAGRSSAPGTSSPLHARHARADQGVRPRARPRRGDVLHGDARELELGGPFDAVVTSPPYPGLIDYHEQHRYAYELLGLDDRRELELGAAARGVEPRRGRGVRGRDRRPCSTTLRRRAPAGRAGADRRQRPPRALPGDPRARRAAARDVATGATSTGAPGGAPASSSRTCSSAATSEFRHEIGTRACSSSPSVAACSHARSRMRSSASSRAASRSRRTSSSASRRSRSSASPTAPARRRSSASAAGSRRPS